MKIIQVVGARPQFIKAAMLSREIRTMKEIDQLIVHTGQHYDRNMSDLFFEEMEIPRPDYNLEIHGLGHGAMTGQMLEKLEKVLLKEVPDWVVVHGDTNSTLAGALAASKLHFKLAHVEAGLRSFNKRMPEEVNRILTDHVSDLLFAPSSTALANLDREGINGDKVVSSGDIMYDSSLFYSEKAESQSTISKDLQLEDFVLCTFHRAENTDDPDRLQAIVRSLNEISRTTRVVLPLHPRTRKIMEQKELSFDFEILEPVSYFDMIQLARGSKAVITDSGGLQKEAYFFDRYCIVLRDETEWVELVDQGASLLSGASYERIMNSYEEVSEKDTRNIPTGIYGNGDTASIIAKSLVETS